MKSLLKTALIFLFIACNFTACITRQEGWAYFDTRYYDIRQWALAANGRYFFAEVDAPAITSNVFSNGVVVGYLVENLAHREVHIPLPYEMFHNETDNYGNTTSWTETVSFDIVPGRITFYYEPSDFFTGDIPPACMFKIVAMW